MKRELPRQPLWTLRSLGRLAWPDRAPKKNCTLVTFVLCVCGGGGAAAAEERGGNRRKLAKRLPGGTGYQLQWENCQLGNCLQESVFTAVSLSPYLWCSKQRLNLDHLEWRCWNMGWGLVWFGFCRHLALSLLCSHD